MRSTPILVPGPDAKKRNEEVRHQPTGSDHIKSLLLEDDDRPIYLLAWGGQSAIARALKSIRDEYRGTPEWPEVRDRISEKAMILAFGDQDNTNETYIAPNWPGIEFRNMANSTYGYGARNGVLPEDQVYLSAAWTRENISSKGPLGSLYRVWGDGKQMAEGDIFDYFGESGKTADELREEGYAVWLPPQEKGSWISEGDTPAYLNLLNTGLRGWVDPTYGGWGGREGMDEGPEGPDEDYASARFFAAAQHDLAARLEWSVTPTYDGANHEPVVSVNGPLDISAEPEQTIHLILEATDDGTPALTRYQRVVVNVAP